MAIINAGTIYDAGGGGTAGILTMDTLWTNPDPSMDFSSAIITVSSSFYDYPIIFIMCRKYAHSLNNELFTGFIKPYTTGLTYIACGLYERGFSVAEKTLTVTDGYYNNEVNNSYAIPVEIYGLHT